MNCLTPETLSGVRPELLQERPELMGFVPAQFLQQIALRRPLQARPLLTRLPPGRREHRQPRAPIPGDWFPLHQAVRLEPTYQLRDVRFNARDQLGQLAPRHRLSPA